MFRRALDPEAVNALYKNSTTSSIAGAMLGASGALQGAQQGQTTSTAQVFANTARSSYNPTAYANPTTYSLECWFRATSFSSANGRTLMSFGDTAAGNSTNHDRKLFLDTSGHLVAGTASGTSGMAQSSSTYINSAWHYAVVTVSPGTGIKLYVDGDLAASAAYSAPGNYTGYWRWGGDTTSASWPTDYLVYGHLDEVAVYGSVLSAQQVGWHYYANH
jgi:hypothetical protein